MSCRCVSNLMQYNYRGDLNFQIRNLIAVKRISRLSKSKKFIIYNSPFRDSKADQTQVFSFVRRKYFQQYKPDECGSNLNNTLNSSISYSKTLQPYRKLECHCLQLTRKTPNEVINMTLPTLQQSVDRIYPFVGDDGVKRLLRI
jgi:hypothetical protein